LVGFLEYIGPECAKVMLRPAAAAGCRVERRRRRTVDGEQRVRPQIGVTKIRRLRRHQQHRLRVLNRALFGSAFNVPSCHRRVSSKECMSLPSCTFASGGLQQSICTGRLLPKTGRGLSRAARRRCGWSTPAAAARAAGRSRATRPRCNSAPPARRPPCGISDMLADASVHHPIGMQLVQQHAASA
jgi:hypothetical protein